MSAVDDHRDDALVAGDGRHPGLVRSCFDVVAGVAAGNPFTNANRLLDHALAFGPDAMRRPSPMLHGGQRLPSGLIEPVMAALREQEWLPECGHLAEA